MHQLIKSLVGLFFFLLATPILTISSTSKDELPISLRSEHLKDQQGDLFRSTGIINNAENLRHQTNTTTQSETEESNDVDLISSRSSAVRELKEVQVSQKAASGGGRSGRGGRTRRSRKNQASSLVMSPPAFVSIGLISLLSYLL